MMTRSVRCRLSSSRTELWLLCVPLADGSLVISLLLSLYNGVDSFILAFCLTLRAYSPFSMPHVVILKYAHICSRNCPFSIISGFVHHTTSSIPIIDIDIPLPWDKFTCSYFPHNSAGCHRTGFRIHQPHSPHSTLHVWLARPPVFPSSALQWCVTCPAGPPVLGCN